ncbi:MAG: alpha/beta hydrolase [bacterium]|nr:alpha/beta hydrolase [bacterium]
MSTKMCSRLSVRFVKPLILAVIPFIILSGMVSGKTPSPTFGSNPLAGAYAKVNGVKLYYESYGRGDALLMLHAGIGSIKNFENCIGAFSKHFRVIAVDTRGHGRSGHDGSAYSYALFAGDMIKLMDHLQVKRFDIVGYSDGGVIGYHLASKYPKRVKALVAAGANYRLDGLTEEFRGFINQLMVPDALKTHSFWKSFRTEYEKLSPTPEGFKAHIERTRKMWRNDPYISPEQFAAINVPVLFVFGDRDAITLDHILHMYRTLPSKITQLCILANTDHFVFQTQSEVLNPIIIGFLEK